MATRTQAPPRYRVEELAAEADCSVDTVRFYQKRRLLPPPDREGRVGWYDAGHLARLRRIRDLQAEGLSLALIGRILRGDLDRVDEPLAAAVANARTPEREELSLVEAAERAGVAPSLLEQIAREGLLGSRATGAEPRFAIGDVALIDAGRRLVDAGIPIDALVELARGQHEAASALAERAVDLFDDHVRAPLRDAPLTDEERAARLVDAFRTMLPAVTALVAGHFERVLLETAERHFEG